MSQGEVQQAERKLSLEVKKLNDRAAAALEKADARELFALFKKSQQDQTDLETVLNHVVSHYGPKGDKPPRLAGEQESIVLAMRDVALAAIELGKAVVLNHDANGGGQ